MPGIGAEPSFRQRSFQGTGAAGVQQDGQNGEDHLQGNAIARTGKTAGPRMYEDRQEGWGFVQVVPDAQGS